MKILEGIVTYYATEYMWHALGRAIIWVSNPKPRANNDNLISVLSRQLAIRKCYRPDTSESTWVYPILGNIDLLRNITQSFSASFQGRLALLSVNSFFRTFICQVNVLRVIVHQLDITENSATTKLSDPMRLAKNHNITKFTVKIKTHNEFLKFIEFLESPTGKNSLDKIEGLSLSFPICRPTIDNINKALALLKTNLRSFSCTGISKKDPFENRPSLALKQLDNLEILHLGNIDDKFELTEIPNLNFFSFKQTRAKVVLKSLPKLQYVHGAYIGRKFDLIKLDALHSFSYEGTISDTVTFRQAPNLHILRCSSMHVYRPSPVSLILSKDSIDIQEITLENGFTDFANIIFPKTLRNLKSINFKEDKIKNPKLLEKLKEFQAQISSTNDGN